MAANVGAMGYFLMEPSFASGITMLGATSAMSALMGVSLFLSAFTYSSAFILYPASP